MLWNVLSVSTSINLNWFNLSFVIHYWGSDHTKKMRDKADKLSLVQIVCDDTTVERKSSSCLGQTFPRSLIVFLSDFLVVYFVWLLLRISFFKNFDDSTASVQFLCSVGGYPLPLPRLWTSFFSKKNCVFISLIGPSEMGKV